MPQWSSSAMKEQCTLTRYLGQCASGNGHTRTNHIIWQTIYTVKDLENRSMEAILDAHVQSMTHGLNKSAKLLHSLFQSRLYINAIHRHLGTMPSVRKAMVGSTMSRNAENSGNDGGLSLLLPAAPAPAMFQGL